MIYCYCGLLLLSLFCLALLLRQWTLHRRQQQLYQNIQVFLRHPAIQSYSLRDDSFALLENAVVDLENRILMEHGNTAAKSRENADFVADISHQLKTPLAGLKLYCEMDSRMDGTHADRQLVLIEHMEQLIHSLLRLENLKADAYAMQFGQEQISVLVKEVWSSLQPLYPGKRMTCSGQAELRCDAKWMQEALLNILKNSCEHTPEDGTIQVQLEEHEASVSIAVRDNGGGVLTEELPKLFHRFFHSARNSNKNSAGIGLAITKEIIRRHHGTIDAENTLDGLCIHICIPIIDGIKTYENVRSPS